MKIRHSTGSGQDKVEIQMTPMIDIVFQLLVFFIMTFKIATQEGDFNIKMPLPGQPGPPTIDDFPPMKLRLRAGAGGELADIVLNNQSFGTSWKALHDKIISDIGTQNGPGSAAANAEVELDCDYKLHYEHVVAAITAVSGYVDPNNNVVKLIEKINFAPPRAEGG